MQCFWKCVTARRWHTVSNAQAHTHQMNCHSPRVGVMTHSGDGEVVCLQTIRVYVWRSDTMALWQGWWVLLVSAQCIWQQGDVTVNGSVMTTGWLFHSWLPVHRCLTSLAISSHSDLWGRSGFLIRKWKKKVNLCCFANNHNQWKYAVEWTSAELVNRMTDRIQHDVE